MTEYPLPAQLRLSLTTTLLVLAACGGDSSDKEVPLAEGIYAPLGEIRPDADPTQRETFARGEAVALHRFTPEEGLGPSFNVTFCAGCHEKPVFGGSAPRYRNFLLVGQTLPDGSFSDTGINGIQATYDLGETARVPSDPLTNNVATRNAVPFFGVGLIAELPGEEILKWEDPDDDDGDGISGRANFDRGFVGRFGRKAQTVSIEGFIRGPLFNHMGITTVPLSDEEKNALPVPSGSAARGLSVEILSQGVAQISQAQAAAPDEPTEDADGVMDPEMAPQALFDLVSWSMLLAAPQPELLSERTSAGSQTFSALGCDGCHRRAIPGPRGGIPLYSDLLLHDMGEASADGVRMGSATGSEFRTQPLWGLASTGPYLHDGSADTVDAAIRRHGGEGEAAANAYAMLPEAERTALLDFLASLGGREQVTDGLLAPGAPIPPVGAFGGPIEALSDADREKFEAGRRVFDRDFGLEGGLGPRFNGDSCRACHFQPDIGGAGPLGVNVIRHGYLDGDQFRPPEMGTMAHRLLADVGTRAPAEEADIFELRQTPPLFGLGLIERIPEATILAAVDPDDDDGDGIRGVAHRLGDGRLGRFGWKADVPSLSEFVRDAMLNEVGVTMPPQEGHSFGATEDDDDTPDPELSLEEAAELLFWLQQLGAPPRQTGDATAIAQGEMVFAQIGCDSCHTPSMQTEDGVEVPLYSDLLLHDVAPADFTGVPSGAATMRQFRTTPLWGLAEGAPFLHNGAATTIEAAVLAHFSEAEASRQAFEALDAAQKAALLTFLGSL